MNKISTLALGLIALCGSEYASAQGTGLIDFGAIAIQGAANMIDWKVGDRADYEVDIGMFGKGTSFKTVSKDDATTLWMHQEIQVMGQANIVDAQINKADGKILELIINGTKTQIPDQSITVISQQVEDITVKAGTFSTIHIVAQNAKKNNIEVWMNTKDIVMSGSAKEIADQGIFKMTSELVSQVRAP